MVHAIFYNLEFLTSLLILSKILIFTTSGNNTSFRLVTVHLKQKLKLNLEPKNDLTARDELLFSTITVQMALQWLKVFAKIHYVTSIDWGEDIIILLRIFGGLKYLWKDTFKTPLLSLKLHCNSTRSSKTFEMDH